MDEWYEVWDIDAGNMIGAFASEAEALVEVRELLEENGIEYAADLALGRRREDAGEQIAEGAALASLAGATQASSRSA